MHYIVTFVVAVAARILAYFICKWLDSFKSNK